jgi:hypothetical protein
LSSAATRGEHNEVDARFSPKAYPITGWSEADGYKACDATRSEAYSWYAAATRGEHNEVDARFSPAWS